MPLLDKKYRDLKPTSEYLTDKVVLAQAWKKSHQTIRSTNWYADTFELDRTAIDLDAHLDEWLEALESDNFSFEPLMLVPAPKASCWNFEKDKKGSSSEFLKLNFNEIGDSLYKWLPKQEESETKGELKPLRPLAHVSIRDQSLLTALMMCLANRVETKQGDAATDFSEVHEKGVVNYGNRLYCHFDQGKAEFGWGNSTTYSKYFTDYQRFLARPAHFGAEAKQQIVRRERVYEVHLDLEKFYDKVNRAKLVEKLAVLADNDDAIVARLLRKFENWEWDSESPSLYEKVCSVDDGKIPKGIPQGLVAGGFFANVYLLEFDEWLANLIGKKLTDNVNLVDYCRYVDDIRLIVVTDGDKPDIEEAISNIILPELCNLGLSFNSGKTRIERFRSKNSGISYKLKDIQSKVSGPLSINEVDEQLGHLEGLISLAENLQSIHRDTDNDNPLALIETPTNDVREDTLLRFSANKIHMLLRQKRSLVTQEVDANGEPIPGSWDYLQERMGRKFIACWSKDPSLVVLLKKGLEFFPDKRVLDPVLKQLLLVRGRNDAKQKHIAEYCLCEIFRHTATVIHSKDRWAIPAHANIETFFECLQQLAIDIITPDFSENEYLNKQARFFLLVRNDSPLEDDTGDSDFNFITKLMKGYRNISAKTTVSSFVANTLLSYQLSADQQLVLRSVNVLLGKLDKKRKRRKASEGLCCVHIAEITRKFAVESMEFFTVLLAYAKENDSEWLGRVKDLVESAGINNAVLRGDLTRFNINNKVSLLAILKRMDNPFAHENALLKLLHAVLEKEGEGAFSHDVDLPNCSVACDDWQIIQSLDAKLEVDLQNCDSALHPMPAWVTEEHKPLYRAGIFIRSCLLGTVDWSSAHIGFKAEAGYSGLKTSFYKRQLGMMHSPEAINGETAPMSSWLTSLLFHLLQWPGVKPYDGGYSWPQQWNLESFLGLVEQRISYQRSFYCHASQIPAYVERVDLGWEKDKANLNVVMVQSLLPLKKDFSNHGIMLDTPSYRARHRRHVAAVAELLLHKIVSQNSIHDEVQDRKSVVDLIIWPELAVNNDDIDILKRLSDKTGAMIFTGLTFIRLPGVKGPNNVGKWIIPKKQGTARHFISRLQGKHNMMADEKGKAQPWRPYQLMIELMHPAFPDSVGFIITGSICYDATDIKLTADLKNKSNAYLVPALNKDVSTFDSMVDALYYHMYQHVVLVNTGEFGGSVAKAPYNERYDKLITHVHGANQVSISSFEMNMFDFRDDVGKSLRSDKKTKTKPAG